MKDIQVIGLDMAEQMFQVQRENADSKTVLWCMFNRG